MTPLARMVAAEHQRQEDERMAEIHEGLSMAARDVGALVVFAVADAMLADLRGFSERICWRQRREDCATCERQTANLGAWRAAWWGGA